MLVGWMEHSSVAQLDSLMGFWRVDGQDKQLAACWVVSTAYEMVEWMGSWSVE
jgi:hypothetical protein